MQKQLSSFLLKTLLTLVEIHYDLVKNIALNPQQPQKKEVSLFTFWGESFVITSQKEL